MARRLFFISGDKSFELKDISEDCDRWFILYERSKRFISSIKVDESNLRWICEALKQASLGYGNRCRRWARKIQEYSYRVTQNFNSYGRYVRIETQIGQRKSAIIIPEIDFNMGWGDIAEKIQRSLGKASSPRFQLATEQAKTYMEAAKILQWPAMDPCEGIPGNEHFLSKCLIRCFNDAGSANPNPSVIQSWFVKRWQVTAGLKVTQINHNQFLFDFPSKQEAIRIKAGDWYWNGRRLALAWWSPASDLQKGTGTGRKWVKVFGIPFMHG